MSRHALEVLEFRTVLERVARRAASELGRASLRDRRPSTDRERVRRELARVSAAITFVEEGASWGMPPVPDVRSSLKQLGVEGVVLEARPLHALATLLSSAREVAREMDRRESEYPELASVRARVMDEPELIRRLERTVDAEGHVLDTASRELRSIRGRLSGARARIVKRLEAFMGRLPERFAVPDASVTIRDGRYVVPVRREGKGEVGGIVHDESHSGATLFVEPPVAIELMNQLRSLEREEEREIRRVLAERTGELARHRHDLQGALEALVELDTLQARARTARAWGGAVPELLEPGAASFALHGARHPLLLESEETEEVIPYDLVIEEGERALVVSGPNTGGKSVFLKATGLIAALTQSGVVPPVGPGTRLPVFSGFYADIGDEQSIARSLSTFSAHLANLKRIVEEADADALVLMDEMGTGTDPAEGAALARAILETLVERGVFAVVSSHLGALKRLDAEGSGIVNASLQFDAERMEPTYHLVKGRPGRSYGLAIARRLGFPGEVLDRAEGYRSEDEVDLEDLLARLEEREREAERTLRELERARARATRLEEEVEERERSVREAERTAEARARKEARKELLDARSEVEQAIEEVRAAAHSREELEEAGRRARRRVEEAVRERDREDEPRRSGPAPELDPGQRVRVRATGARGTVVELRDDRALVEVGALKMELPAADLERVEGADGSGGKGGGRTGVGRRGATAGPKGGGRSGDRGGWTGPSTEDASTEVDLRGLRVDEMEIELSRALDGAVVAGLPSLRIIHGKGTGALRRRTQEMLDQDARVAEHRFGKPREGGAGVTVVTFR
jgi:DNA mismatch repair protein MutS2